MKKTILVVLAALSMTAACTEVQTSWDSPDQERMTLKALSGVPTKAPVADATFPTSRSMVIAATHKPSSSESGATTGTYFVPTEFRYNTGLNAWTAWPEARYWPLNGSLSLLAWSVADGTNTLTPTGTTWIDASDRSKGVALTLPDNSVKQVDVLFAGKEKATRESNTLVFKHALSWLEFQASCDVPGKITITGVTLNNAAHSGRVTARRAIDDVSMEWDNLGDRKNVTVSPSPVVLNNSWQKLGDGLLIPPQERMTPDGTITSFTIHYQLPYSIGGNPVEMEYLCPFETPKWEAGTKYVYKISMTLNSIKVAVSVSSWTDEVVEVEVPSYDFPGTTGKVFSVGAERGVCFTTANLMFDMVDGKYKLLENAYDVSEAAGENVGDNYLQRRGYVQSVPEKARIALFGWGTAGSLRQHVTTTYRNVSHYSCDVAAGEFDPYYDWGNNVIYTHDNVAVGGKNTWRTLSKDEWFYVFRDRANASQKYALAQIVTGSDTFYGIVLLPDDWSLPSGCSFSPGPVDYADNSYSLTQWSAMESAGAVFLPAAGYRDGDMVSETNGFLCYWSSTTNSASDAYCMSSDYGDYEIDLYYRWSGSSVRLVRQGYPAPTAAQTKNTSGKAFSVGSGAQDIVFFATSNLYYDNNTLHLHLMEHAYDMLEKDNENIGECYCNTGRVSLFGWGASEVERRPVMTTIKDSRAYLSTLGLQEGTDWGLSNSIWSADGATLYGGAGTFRTLSSAEWNYLLSGRTDGSQKYGTATITVSATVRAHGLVLLPDSWKMPAGCTFTPGSGSWSRNEYSAAQWADMEAAGAVFLPAAGSRNGTTVGSDVSTSGYYWTSSIAGNHSQASCFGFNETGTLQLSNRNLYYGSSVRLVRNAE